MSSNHTSATGCPVHEALPHDPVPFFSSGDINFKAHDVGWLVCGTFTLIATVTSCWLIRKHLSFFYHPTEQRHIVRLLAMPIVYAICSFLSYFWYRQALYFQLVRDCYEAIVIAEFFFLLVSYLSNPPPTSDDPIPTPYATKAERDAQLRESIKDLHLEKWMWPLGRLKWRPADGGPGEGEAFLWLMRVLVGQYVLVRPLSTLASVIGEATGYYCLASWSPKFIHVWASAAITVSVTVAMYCVLQLYMPLREPLKPYQPVLKFLCVKLVVFFTFWQETALSFLVTVDVIKNRQYWTAEEIVIGFSALLSCLEMVIFAFLHIKAFSYLPYRALASPVRLSPDGTPLLSALDDSPADLEAEKAHSFASWSAWNARVAARDAALSRLAKPKLPSGFDLSSGDVPRKPDGLPLLQQTRTWPALLAVLDLRDLFGEIGDETRFVFRGGRVDEAALLDARRRDDLEKAFGGRRPMGKGGESGHGEGEKEGETGLERDLRRLREGRPRPSSLMRLAGNGTFIAPVASSAAKCAGSAAPAGLERADLIEEVRAPAPGWWASLRGVGSRPPRPALDDRGSFEQLPRLDYDRLAVKNVPAVVGADWRIPVPPAHRAGTPLRTSFRPRPAPTQPRRPQPPRKDPSTASSVAASHDSFTHLPRTSLRPASYVPPHRAAPLPSPPPFSYFHRQSSPSIVSSERSSAPIADPLPAFSRAATAHVAADSRARSHSSIVPSMSTPQAPPPGPLELAAPPAVLLMASTESRRSHGLPPGAMPPRS
ncbi:hypothetical protein JCM9279_001565 [Rhodotorula babjevae]